MFEGLKRIAMGAALAAASLSLAATPAQARDRYGDGGDDAAIAIGAGIIGLAIGAAIASNHNDRYDRRYYRSYPSRDYYYYDGSYYNGYPRYRNNYRNYRRDYRRDYRRSYDGWGSRSRRHYRY